jgi:sulfite exporter TauE/SafE
MSIPTELSAVAESLVGVVLIAIGIYVMWDLLHKNAHLHFHNHDGLPKHAHWHVHAKIANTSLWKHSRSNNHYIHGSHKHDHGAVMVGILHGMAGSAPLLALIPLSNMGSPWLGVLYMAVFGVGVIVAMLLFGGVLAGVYKWISCWGDRMVRSLRFAVGLSSIGFGGYLLIGVA